MLNRKNLAKASVITGLVLACAAILLLRLGVSESPVINNIVKAALIIAGLAVTAAWMIGERQHGTSKVTFYFYMLFTAAIWSVIYCITYMWT